MNNNELAAMIARNFYAADDDSTADMLAHWNEHFATLDACIAADLTDMLHNGNLDDLIDAPLIADDTDYDAMLDRLLDDDCDIAPLIAAILTAR
jgi:hypothetical protein